MKKRRSLKLVITALTMSVAFAAGCARRAPGLGGEEEDKLFTEDSAAPGNITEGSALSEPFFISKKITLQAPVPEDLVAGDLILESGYNDDPVIVGDHILVHTSYNFQDPEEPEIYTSASAWNVFDLSGNYLFHIDGRYLSNQVIFDEDANGNLAAAFAEYNFIDDTWHEDVSYVKFDPQGNLLAGPVYVFSDKFSDCLSFAVNDANGETVITTQHKVVQIDEEGVTLSSVSFDNASGFRYVWEEAGELYMQTTAMGESGLEEATIFHIELLDNGFISLSETGRNATSLLSMKMYQTNSGVYASTRNALGKLDISSGEFSSLLDWNQTDLDRSTIFYGDIKVLSEGNLSHPVKVIEAAGEDAPAADVTDAPRSDYSDETGSEKTSVAITALEYMDESMTPVLYILSSTDDNPHEGQDILWVGGIGISSSGLMTSIARFNESNDQNIWIKVYDYAGFDYDKSYAFASETQKALEKMAAQVSSGMGPDIIIGGGESGIFDNSSILTDLNGYIDGISGINRDDYFNSALESFETDGKLYQIPLVFSVRALIGNRSLVNGKTTMNYSDYIEARNYLDETSYLFSEMSLEELCNILVEGETGTWINYSNGSVMVDHEKLMDMLQLLLNEDLYGMNSFFAVEGSPDFHVFDPVDRGYYTEIFENSSAFAPSTMNNVGEYALTKLLPTLSWYGYPGSQGSSMIIQSDVSVGISASSNQKEKAWEVIKFLLQEDVQTGLSRPGYFDAYRSNGFVPLNRDAFLEVNSEDEYPPEIFTYALNEDGSWSESFAGQREDLLKEYEEALNVPMRRYIRDPEVIYIVEDVADKYFFGECSLSDAAYEIEKRITEHVGR